jgi:hypothetical protein
MDYRALFVALLYIIIIAQNVLVLFVYAEYSHPLTWWWIHSTYPSSQDDVVNPQIVRQHTVAKQADRNLYDSSRLHLWPSLLG